MKADKKNTWHVLSITNDWKNVKTQIFGGFFDEVVVVVVDIVVVVLIFVAVHVGFGQ